MPNTLYQTTQELHEIIQAKAEKYGLKIELKDFNKNVVIGNAFLTTADYYKLDDYQGYRAIEAIQPPQIRQILLVFREVLDQLPNPYWIGADNLCAK